MKTSRYLIGSAIGVLAIVFGHFWQMTHHFATVDIAIGRQTVNRDDCYRLLRGNRGRVTVITSGVTIDSDRAFDTPATPSIQGEICVGSQIVLNIEHADLPQ